MKMLYISNSRIPTEKAHGIQIMKTCAAFAKHSVNLTLILPNRKNPEFKNINPFDYYKIKNKFEIKKIKSLNPHWLMKLPNGIYIKFQILFFINSLFFYLLKIKHNNKLTLYTRDEYLLPTLLKFSNKVIWEAHTLPKNTKYYKKYWQKCYKIITITNGLKNELINHGLAKEKIAVISDGVDLNVFNFTDSKLQIRQKLNLPINQKIIMYTGHLYNWKGVQTLADTSEYLDNNCCIIFVGGTEDNIKKFKEKNKHLNKLIILGQFPHHKIPAYLKSADVLVLPNSSEDKRSKFWTSPLKMFEYMAAEIPVIAAALPSVKEILNENNALFFKPDNSQDLATKIKYVLDNPNKAQKLAKQAKQNVQHYTWQKRAEKIINFINA